MIRRGVATALALVLGGCGAAPQPPSSPPKAAEPAVSPGPPAPRGEAEEPTDGDGLDAAEAARKVAAMLARVADARSLPAKRAVASHVLARGALLHKIREHVDREIPPDVIRGQGEVLVALGLVPPDFDYLAGTFRLLESQLAGFYEPSDEAMYLADDLGDRATEATLAHELVHALQDQYYALGPKLAYRDDANDAESAVQGLAEGDATSAMMDVLLAEAGRKATDVPDRVFTVEVEASIAVAPETAKIPRVLRSSLVAPYVDGVLFVHALRRRGGWAAVDAAWRSPPETTEQLLHLDKYDAHERPVALPEPPPPDREAWKVAYDDVFGEQGLRIALEDWVPKRTAAVAAAGWAGDRATLVRRGPEGSPTYALLWHLRFDKASRGDPDGEAREAFRAIAGTVHPGGATRVCVDRPGLGPRAVVRVGRDVIVASGPYRHEGATVTPDGDCAHTLRWAIEALANRAR